MDSGKRVNSKTINVGANLGYCAGSNRGVTADPGMPYAHHYMYSTYLRALTLLLPLSAAALPSDFAGLKLGQNLGATKKFLFDKGHNIIYPDGKILWAKGEKTFKPEDLKKTISGEAKSGQICTVSFDPLSPKAKHPHIQSFNCGVVKGKELNTETVIDSYIISHFMTDKDEKAFYLTYLFNLKTAKPAGAGLIGKLGEPDTVNSGQPCPAFIKEELKLRPGAAAHGCFVAIWLPDGSEVMATAIGFGANLQNGKVARLELWDMEAQKKVEAQKASKAADDLGF